MKKLIIVIVVALLPSLFFAQQSVFDKFDGPDEVTTVVVNQKMFEMISGVKMEGKDKETQQYLKLVKKLHNLKVFTTANTKIAADMKATTEKYLKTAGLEELMRVNDGGQNIRILIKTGGTATQVKELLMFIEGSGKNETVLMSLTGNFDLNELSVLTDKMNLPGGSVLTKASKGK